MCVSCCGNGVPRYCDSLVAGGGGEGRDGTGDRGEENQTWCRALVLIGALLSTEDIWQCLETCWLSLFRKEACIVASMLWV